MSPMVRRGKRILAVTRLSRDTDESTSIRRQTEHLEGWAQSVGGAIVGWVEDVDVSGTVRPWDRESFGQWLTDERAGEYDVIAAIKIDRLSRSLRDFVDLIDWADARGIAVVAFQDGIDTSTQTGKLIAKLLAVFAEFERERIRERVMDSMRDSLRNGTWHGGTPPIGYMPVKGPDAKWRLVPDTGYVMRGPDGSDVLVVHEIVRRVIAGDSLNSIAYDLNAAGVLTSEDRHAERSGKEVKGYRWAGGNIEKLLRSRALMGETVDERGRVKVRDDQGLPVLRAEPLISEREWERLQSALDARKITPRRSRMVSPLSGLLWCGVCGLPMYRFTDNHGVDRYRCKSATGKAENGQRCGNPSVNGDMLAQAVENIVISHIGSEPVVRRVFRKGADHSRELEQVERAIRELRDDADAGLFPDRDDYRKRMRALLDRKAQLETLPNEPDRWVDEPTGETFADRWRSLANDAERREFLLSTGARFTLTGREGSSARQGQWEVRLTRGETSRVYLMNVHEIRPGERVVSVLGEPLSRPRKGR